MLLAGSSRPDNVPVSQVLNQYVEPGLAYAEVSIDAGAY